MNKPLAGAQSCDVAIIGGGYTGLSAAWHVISIEFREIGYDAPHQHGAAHACTFTVKY